MSERNHRVQHRQGEHGVHTVLDDEFLPPSGKENNECGKGKNGKQFNGDIPDLGRSGRSEGVEFAHVVVGSDVQGKGNGHNEHGSHADHSPPLFSHQRSQAFPLAKFVLHLSEALRDFSPATASLSIAHGCANSLSHISLAFFQCGMLTGKEAMSGLDVAAVW